MTNFASERNRQSKYMASNSDFVQYIADQCAGAGEIKVRKMFGDYGIYCDGKIFGLVCDDHFYVKPTEAGRAVLRTVDLRPPYDGAKDYFYIADVDDHEYLAVGYAFVFPWLSRCVCCFRLQKYNMKTGDVCHFAINSLFLPLAPRG